MPYGGNDWLALTQEATLEPDIPICPRTVAASDSFLTGAFAFRHSKSVSA